MENCIQVGFESLVKVRIIEYIEAQKAFIHPDRRVDFHVFLFLVSGEMRIWEDNIEYVLRPGEIFFLRSGIHHWGEYEIPAGTKWYYIHFYSDVNERESKSFNDYGNFVDHQEFLAKDYAYFIILPKQFKADYPSMLEKKLDSLCKMFHSNNPLRLLLISSAVLELFYEIYSSSRKRAALDKGDIITQRIIDYLQRTLKENISSSDISRNINLNYNYISQIFKKKTGMNITEYHTKMRIIEASRLLRESSLNVSEISNILGYQDPLYFSHVFKRVTGISPREYQKQSYGF